MANALAPDHILTRRPSAILQSREKDLARLAMDFFPWNLPTTTLSGLLALRGAITSVLTIHERVVSWIALLSEDAGKYQLQGCDKINC